MQLRVLLADDHAVFRESAKAMLERRGFAVVGEAANGLDAVRLAMQFQPDVALVDLSMPVLNGLDVARQILEVCGNTRVIALTVHRDEHNVMSALRSGACGYIVKSKLADDLGQALTEVLRGKIWVSSLVRYAAVEDWILSAEMGC